MLHHFCNLCNLSLSFPTKCFENNDTVSPLSVACVVKAISKKQIAMKILFMQVFIEKVLFGALGGSRTLKGLDSRSSNCTNLH